MKIRSIVTGAFLGAVTLFTLHTTKAALSYTAGDLFLGFQQTGNNTDLLVNIGNVAAYSKLDGSSFTVNVGGTIGSDLAATFGDTWNQQSTLFWSVSGTTFANLGDSNTIYLSKARTNIANQTSPWVSNTNNGQADQVNFLKSLAGAYLDDTATGNSTKATLQLTSQPNSYASFTANTSSDFQWGNVEGRFNNGSNGAVLDLYRVTPSFGGTAATYLGKFTINDTGVITYTSAVPEPATTLLIGAALAFLFIVRRRRASGAF